MGFVCRLPSEMFLKQTLSVGCIHRNADLAAEFLVIIDCIPLWADRAQQQLSFCSIMQLLLARIVILLGGCAGSCVTNLK